MVVACCLFSTGGTGAVRAAAAALADEVPVLASFRSEAEPMLDRYCYDCHGYGGDKGGVVLDDWSSDADLLDHPLWLRVLRNVRAGVMPPAEEAQPDAAERAALITWIKAKAFQLDPTHPDPGRVTVRRLNRVEYRNTVRALTGGDYDTSIEFPADDTGHGFDNIADVLTISPMLLEKYLDAAQAIIDQAVPKQARVVAEQRVLGRSFGAVAATTTSPHPLPADGATDADWRGGRPSGSALDLLYYTPATVAAPFTVTQAGRYEIAFSYRAVERYVDNQFDLNRCRVVFKVDGEPILTRELAREGESRDLQATATRDWAAGEHVFTVEVTPLTPAVEQVRQLRMRLNDVVVRGPLAPAYWVQPDSYARFFPRPVPTEPVARTAYARELLADFAFKAFRRPVAPDTVDRLVNLAERASAQPDGTFEAGVAQAMVAVLASPRFLFRFEEALPLPPGERFPDVDEYALASRLSYFFWSSMPDAELFRLAAAGTLRANLTAQVERLLADPRSQELVRNFAGQWLEARDILNVPISDFSLFLREHPNPAALHARDLFREISRIPEAQRTPAQAEDYAAARETYLAFVRQPKPELTWEIRRAMQQETEMTFDYVLREDRSVLELIESDYTFLNAALAEHYGLEALGVTGEQLRKVQLPPDSPRGGVLTQGTVLTVTSNPTRTSPVKRGVFILDNILGMPPPPPPPNIPPLENVASEAELARLSLRETLALHASNPMCASCHSRMDPLGLALENFNAMGRWRDEEMNQPIAPAGALITGETFADVRELKHLLATRYRDPFLHTLTEKLLTYALGRGMDYYDTETLDQIVARFAAADGRPSALIAGIIESAAFQKTRPVDASDRPDRLAATAPAAPETSAAEAGRFTVHP